MPKFLKLFARNYGLTMLTIAVFGYITPSIFNLFHNYADIFLIIALFLGCLKIQFTEFKHLKQNFIKLLIYVFISIIFLPLIFHYTINFIEPEFKLGLFLMLATAGGVTAPMIANILNLKILWTTSYVIISSLIIPISIPLLVMNLYAIQVQFSYVYMSLFLLKLVLIPAVLAMIFKKFLPQSTNSLIKISSGIGPIIIGLFIAILISKNQSFISEHLFQTSTLTILLGLTLVFLLKFTIGYLLPSDSTQEKLSTSSMFGINNNGLIILLSAQFFSEKVLLVVLLSQIPWILSQPIFEKFSKKIIKCN
jgi:bile acid:Na+ symporter, BASS family